MKVDNTIKRKVGNYDVYERISNRGWAIIIMPSGIRIDTFHGFSHIHFSPNGKKHKINVNDMESALSIIDEHIFINTLIDKEKLLEELL